MSEAYTQLEKVAAELGLTVEFKFVPQRFDDRTKVTDMGLKWIVDVVKDGKMVVRSTYTQGAAHCESYPKTGRMTVADYEAIQTECLQGPKSGQPKQPLDALWCIAQDCQGVSNHAGFEHWASQYGYDPDSRKAEGIYRECQNHWTTLRYYIGDAGIDALANVEL